MLPEAAVSKGDQRHAAFPCLHCDPRATRHGSRSLPTTNCMALWTSIISDMRAHTRCLLCATPPATRFSYSARYRYRWLYHLHIRPELRGGGSTLGPDQRRRRSLLGAGDGRVLDDLCCGQLPVRVSILAVAIALTGNRLRSGWVTRGVEVVTEGFIVSGSARVLRSSPLYMVVSGAAVQCIEWIAYHWGEGWPLRTSISTAPSSYCVGVWQIIGEMNWRMFDWSQDGQLKKLFRDSWASSSLARRAQARHPQAPASALGFLPERPSSSSPSSLLHPQTFQYHWHARRVHNRCTALRRCDSRSHPPGIRRSTPHLCSCRSHQNVRGPLTS